jgi:serine/threonine protein kinase
MAEVYRARDTRLDRTVAIKVLPGHLSDDPEARQRFEREAKSISSLNNTNVCTLHDVGKHDSIDFLVMEFLEGETLADRLRRGPLPGDQVLKIGAEVCDGLDKAHRCGVIHRDLKPGNIMLTRSGAQARRSRLPSYRRSLPRHESFSTGSRPTAVGWLTAQPSRDARKSFPEWRGPLADLPDWRDFSDVAWR